MASAVFTVNGGSSAGGVAVTASTTVNLALSSSSGVNTVAWSFIGSHDDGASYPTITNGDTKGLTASFPVGSGVESWLLQCVVNGSLDENDEYDANLTTTAVIGVALVSAVPAVDGMLLLASNETTERSATHGWTSAINDILSGLIAVSAYIDCVVRVGKSGADYTTIQGAIDSISDASSSRIYAVLVYPGLYEEKVTTKAYVNVLGMSREGVRIKYASATGAVRLYSNSSVQNLTIEADGVNTDFMVYGNDVSSWTLRGVRMIGTVTETARMMTFIGSTWSGGLIEDCYGITYSTSTAATITGNSHDVSTVVRNCKFDGAVFRALSLNTCDGVSIESSRLVGADEGLYVDGSAALRNSTAEGSVIGIRMAAGATLTVAKSDFDSYISGDGSVLTVDGRAVESLDASTYSWVNQESTAYNETRDGGAMFTKSHSGATASLSLRVCSTPTPPYTYTARVETLLQKDGLSAGLAWRTSSTSVITAVLITNGTLRVDRYTNETTFGSNLLTATVTWSGPIWLRIRDDATNRKVDISPDGEDWAEVFTEGRTVTHTANQVGLVLNANNAATPNLDAILRLDHLLLES